MSQEMFKVKPVASYEKARYFAAPTNEANNANEDDELDEGRLHPLMLFVMFLLIAGISIGLIGCYMRTEYTTDPPVPDGGPDGDPPPPPPPPPCDEGTVRCADEANLETCEDGEWGAQGCDEYCIEHNGYDSYSYGCDADAEDPCQCEYDIIDGDVDPCYPNDLYCVDEDTMFVCGDEWREVECADYCIETFGPDHHPTGCDPEAEDPCGCFYDMLEGVVATCEPGDVICSDEWNVQICDELGEYHPQNCDEYCVETNGFDWYSTGCNADAEDPCQCEYGMIDGDMVECVPGDVMCVDDATLGECPEYFWQPIDCLDRCIETHGDSVESAGCDETAEDPCQCIVAGSGSGK